MPRSVRRGFAGRLAMMACVAAMAGCGGGDEDRVSVVPVYGSVTYKGQPVAGAHVVFQGPPGTPIAYGTTADDGRYKLTTYDEADGAAPGDHVVSVSKVTGGAVAAPAPSDSAAIAADMDAAAKRIERTPPAKMHLPVKYASAATSKLNAKVEPGAGNVFKFELTD